MMEWISVKDRLPEKTGKYKTKGMSGSMSPKPFEETTMFFKRPNHGYFGNAFDWTYVTHWKPEGE